MPGDGSISNDELARRLEHHVRDLHDDLSEIKTDLAKLVPREVYDAHRAALNEQMLRLEQRIAAAEKTVADQEERERGRNRWLISAFLIPIVLLVVQLWLKSKGAL